MTVPATAPVAAAPAQVSNWTGFYVGGQIGALQAETEALAEDFGIDASGNVDVEIDGTFAGIHAGYMYDLGSVVVGAELDYDIIDFNELSATFEGTTFTESVDDTDDTVTRLKLRAGYDVGRFLPYATAGVARLDSDNENTNGTFFGAGLAFAATQNILVGGEILQHQFDDAFESGLDIDVTTMSLRGSYKF